MKKTVFSFTLIELLIVVAIIAILAAVAVPNFLEAQMRGRVAAEKADCRSTITAWQAYHVDWGRYPDWYTAGRIMSSYLTTPIPYMTSPARDWFFEHGPYGNKPGYESPRYVACVDREYWGVTDSKPGKWSNTAGKPYDWIYENTFRLFGPNSSLMMWSWGPSPTEFYWFLGSKHPNRYPGSSGTVIGSYDPTNGTVSFGYILMFD